MEKLYEEILAYEKSLETQLEEMVDSERIIEELNKDKEKLLRKMEEKAEKIHELRINGAKILERKNKK